MRTMRCTSKKIFAPVNAEADNHAAHPPNAEVVHIYDGSERNLDWITTADTVFHFAYREPKFGDSSGASWQCTCKVHTPVLTASGKTICTKSRVVSLGGLLDFLKAWATAAGQFADKSEHQKFAPPSLPEGEEAERQKPHILLNPTAPAVPAPCLKVSNQLAQ